jgi:hypothetical protein
MPRRARSAALFDRQIRPSSRKRIIAAQRLRAILDRLGDGVFRRELSAFGAQPDLERGNKRSRSVLPEGKADGGIGSVDLALDGKQLVDAAHSLDGECEISPGRFLYWA